MQYFLNLHLKIFAYEEMNVNVEKFEAALLSAHNVVIVGHLNPDGDAVGSVTALYRYLSGRGIDSRIIFPSEYAATFGFLIPAEAGKVIVAAADGEAAEAAICAADLIVCLDMNGPSRTDSVCDAIRGSKAFKVLIDHHLNPERECFDIVYSEIEISSASELLFWVLMGMSDVSGDARKLGGDVARALYAGMMTDTNNFSNSVFPSTFEMASMLIAAGVDKTDLQERILSNYSISRMRLMGHLLSENMVYVSRYKAAYMVLTEADKAKYSFVKGDSEGFVNLPLSSGDVGISALFTEDAEGGFIRVSLRSKGKIDVNALAHTFFNGGGHRNASGGRLYIPVGDVPRYFEESLEKFYGA